MVGHDVGEVVRAACLQVDIVDRVGHGGGGGDEVAGKFEVTDRRFDPPASSKASARSRGGAASPTASSAVRIRWAPLLSPSTTQAQPKPLTRRSASGGSCRLQRGGVDVGPLDPGEGEMLGLAAAAHPVVDDAAAAANQAACAARARSDIPASVIASRANARMLSSSR